MILNIFEALLASILMVIVFTNITTDKLPNVTRILIFAVAFGIYIPKWLNIYVDFINRFYLIILFISVFLIIICTTKNKLLNIISGLTGYIISVVISNLLLLIWNVVFKIDYQMIDNMPALYFIFNTSYTLIIYLITRLLRHLLRKHSDLTTSKNTILVLTELLFCVIIMVFNISYGNSIGFPSQFIYFNCILFFLYFLLGMILVHRISQETKRNMEIEKEIELYETSKSYIRSLESATDQLRNFRHDYSNILLTMDNLIHSDKHEELKEYFDTYIKPTSKCVNFPEAAILSLANINDDYIKSIVSSKLELAFSENIEVTLEVKEQIEINGVEPIDISRILGIYLDNSIEAAIQCDKPFVRIAISKSNSGIFMCIENSTQENSINLASISEKNYSSKGIHRGLGLYLAKEILNKYDNIRWETSTENNIFTQKIYIDK